MRVQAAGPTPSGVRESVAQASALIRDFGGTQRRVRPDRAQGLWASRSMGELGRLSLADALDFLLLLSEMDPARFDPAAARWHARFFLEARMLPLADSQPVTRCGSRAPVARADRGTRHDRRSR